MSINAPASDEVGGNSAHPVGQGSNIRGRESKRATASNWEVAKLLAYGSLSMKRHYP